MGLIQCYLAMIVYIYDIGQMMAIEYENIVKKDTIRMNPIISIGYRLLVEVW
jgi:hypothetical protein